MNYLRGPKVSEKLKNNQMNRILLRKHEIIS